MAGVWPESAGGVAWEGRGLPEGDDCVGDSRTSAGEGHLVDNPRLEVRYLEGVEPFDRTACARVARDGAGEASPNAGGGLPGRGGVRASAAIVS